MLALARVTAHARSDERLATIARHLAEIHRNLATSPRRPIQRQDDPEPIRENWP